MPLGADVGFERNHFLFEHRPFGNPSRLEKELSERKVIFQVPGLFPQEPISVLNEIVSSEEQLFDNPSRAWKKSYRTER